MILVEVGQMAVGSAAHVAQAGAAHAARILADPAPDGASINTDNVLSFVASRIAPILLAVLGVIFIGRASKGEVSRVLTSSAIALIGLSFIAGAGVLFLLGKTLVDTFLVTK